MSEHDVDSAMMSQYKVIRRASEALNELIQICRSESTKNVEFSESALLLAVANSSGFCNKTTNYWNNTTTGWVLLSEICGVYTDQAVKDAKKDDDDDEMAGESKFNAACASASN